MVDEFIRDKGVPAAKSATKSAVQGVKNALSGFGAGLSDWFQDFRWIEFTTAVTAAFAAGTAMATSLMLSSEISHKIGLFGAGIGAICYVRSPKTKWEAAIERDPSKTE